MSLFEKHQPLIERAIQAIQERTFYTPYPEHHKAYPEEGMATGKAAFEQQLGQPFNGLASANDDACWVGEEMSPYTLQPLGITYPAHATEALIAAANEVKKAWKNTSIATRAGILAEALDRIQSRYFEMAHATVHTTGQSFMMAFQASGPHANDRALEAMVLGYQELTRFPKEVAWQKPMGKFNITLNKTFTPVPKGIGVVIGCSTFPVWNSVPGIFANLIAGNPVVVKPHPKAILPIAIVVEELQGVLQEEGINPLIVQLAVDTHKKLIAKELVDHPDVALVDYTGGTEFGMYVEGLRNKTVFTEKAGVNSVIIDSVNDLNAVVQNLAFSVCLYSGQMCTAPQNFFIPATGVKEGDAIIPFEEVVARFKQAVEGVVQHPKMGAGTLAALQNEETLFRVNRSKNLGVPVLEPNAINNAEYEQALTCTPSILQVNSNDEAAFASELFGPIVMLIKTTDTNESIALAQRMARTKGAITCAAYTTDDAVEAQIREAMEEAFTPVSFNLTGFIWVNQAAAFSDFHVTGGNPAGNASFTNPEYVNKRFVWVGHRKLAQ